MANRQCHTDRYAGRPESGRRMKHQDRGVPFLKSTSLLPVSSRALLAVVLSLQSAAWAQPGAPASRVAAEEAAWSKPDSIFGLLLFTAFISTSPGLT
jgi:hypothetical protein